MAAVRGLDASDLLPARFRAWFAARGWRPRPHQLALMDKARQGRSALLVAPTGGGKTLAGFLPSLVALAERDSGALHTLYVSPLKALAVDVARNVEVPIAEMKLAIRVETRTGDTPAARRQRQKRRPPEILMTTPEQLALLIASPDAADFFAGLRRVVLDELHALVTSKRGDLLALGLARLRRLAPGLTVTGLSATVADPDALRAYLSTDGGADLVTGEPGAAPAISVLETGTRLPWAGHLARHAVAEIYAELARRRTTLIFVNTRAQAELVFQDLWRINELALPIALHHGSLQVDQRRRVEAAMAAGKLRAVVATSTLDLGIDWGDVDLVVQIGAPKGVSRLHQRIGRANHRLDEPSNALLVPANRFEVLECRAAVDALAEGAQDTEDRRRGGLDVLAQHILGMACAAPFDADELFAEVVGAAPYADLDRDDFDRVLDFVATGGYALRAYDRYARIRRNPDGRWRVSSPRVAQQYRLNVGTIVEAEMLRVRLMRGGTTGGASHAGRIGRGGRVLGHVEEWFIEQLAPGDTFLFAGEVLRFEALRDNETLVSRAADREPKIPSYEGGKFPLSTFLAARVRAMLAEPERWGALPPQVAEWLELQARRSVLPGAGDLLLETFPRGRRHHLVAYPFEGRLAHQTLGMLLTRRLERMNARPLGFVASEYALGIWCAADVAGLIREGRIRLDALFDEDMLGDDLEAWLHESNLMKRSFRQCALIAGLIERRHPGREKTGRQISVSSDLVYDVLRSHEPDHILLRAARADAAAGLLDIRRLGLMLARVKGRIVHRALPRVSPLAVPILLEIGRETVGGTEAALAEAAAALLREIHAES